MGAYTSDVLESVPGGPKPTEQELTELRAYREQAETESLLEANEQSDREKADRADLLAIPASEIAQMYSERAYELIIDFEVGGRSEYERKYQRPEWPQGESGVTIGVGYDLGYNTLSDFDAEWHRYLSDDQFRRLAGAIGKRRSAAAQYLPQVRDIAITWDKAETVYKATTVQKFSRLVLATFPNARILHPHAFGALLSLVFNRGVALKGERRREMMNIYSKMSSKRFAEIPLEFRAMCRLWPDMAGLRKRRIVEAALFEQGLIEMDRATQVASAPPPIPAVVASSSPTATSRLESIASSDGGQGDWANQPDDITEDLESARSLDEHAELESAPAGWVAVTWVSDDDKSTEYRHIRSEDRDLRGCSFTFTPRDLELLIRANSFEPTRDNNRIVFGLRGATLEADTANPGDRGKQVERAGLRLKETRPDHAHFNCVIGVYNLRSGRLSGFAASTVPKRSAVWGYKQNPANGGNMLPCGCYSYVVGTHRGKTPGCLREGEPFTVLRSSNNLVFDIADEWDECEPFDNIHPAFQDGAGSAEFSSLGCQVIRGSYNGTTGRYSGEWADFRLALGLSPNGHGDDGKRYSYVLLTGLEAAIASKLRDQGQDTSFTPVFQSLVRLRQGSRGEAVRKLQGALRMPQDGIFTAKVKKAFAEAQKGQLHWADGVYAPKSDGDFGLAVFGGAVPPVATASADTTRHMESIASRDGSYESARLESLYAEVGRRSQLAAIDPVRASAPELPQYESVTTESLADLANYGKRVAARIERAAQELICGDSAEDVADRGNIQQQMLDAAKINDQALVDVLAKFIASHLSIINPIAGIIAEILVQKVIGPSLVDAKNRAMPAINCACTAWAKSLSARHGDVASVRVGAVAALTGQGATGTPAVAKV